LTIQIAKEGNTIIIAGLIVTLIFIVLAQNFEAVWLTVASMVMVLYTGFCINFFRDPRRLIPVGDNLLVSSADGQVVKIAEINSPHHGGKATVVSVFLNVFNVHANRIPMDGIVETVEHFPGKFLAAFDHRASDENERSVTVYTTDSGKIVLKQIAGLIARRILNYSKPGVEVKHGEKMGFIMFGSRTDIIFPTDFIVKVNEGQKVVGGETILAELT